ncbi:MAG: bifunctional (p)ppGpp synthetase/guanosine-3',5'-bis(diphosphate) 3'-pyrophosphohydrolase [Phycisphaerales bacterium]|nr:bifunctional (p)ppGpp synthetase/guanosine-3',5'-bis(diphosphate) 3'-pyrophosphohydrolase [Phycisphaerales bacterium]
MESPLYLKAVSFAARAHDGQLRKDKRTPYVAHVFRVAMIARDVFGCDDQTVLCTALLHDTIEDRDVDFDDIEKRFGIEIANCVAATSKNMLLREPEREVDYDQRLAQAPWQARLVKLADVFDNAQDFPKPSMRQRAIDRCKRALVLSEGDADRACFGAARAAVQRIVDELDG